MPTVIAYHDVKDKDHWLSSPKREEFFGPLGVTNIRTFVDPQNPSRVAVLMDVADLDAVMAAMEAGGRRGDGARRRRARDARDPRRGIAASRKLSASPSTPVLTSTFRPHSRTRESVLLQCEGSPRCGR